MADLYRVVYVSTGSQPHQAVNVSATSEANAIAAAKAGDSSHKQHVSASIIARNIIVGS